MTDTGDQFIPDAEEQARRTALFEKTGLDVNRLPRHVAVIMDGNGRWAKERNLPRVEGHRKGVDAVREAVEGVRELGIPYLTLFALSKENLKRPAKELDALMDLLRQYLVDEIPEMLENNIRMGVIGSPKDLRTDVRDQLFETMEATKGGRALKVVLALSYSSRAEIVDAANRSIQAGEKELSEESFARYLHTSDLPDPDLVIRTSGEFRVSNFLLWQAAYAEIHITTTLWPDFSRADLYAALHDYARRERRFGLTGEQIREQAEAVRKGNLRSIG